MAYLNIIRPVNLFIVALTQYIVHYYFILSAEGEISILNDFYFALFVADTVLIAAGGFVINDIFDTRADVLNKPEKTYIPYKISVKSAWFYYVFITLTGFIISCFIGFGTQSLRLIWIYPVTVSLLYFYSYKLKSVPLAGNIVVSLFVAFVPGILLFVRTLNVSQVQSFSYPDTLSLNIVTGYVVFAFMTNLIREIVKDAEDIDGDKKQNINTFPLKFGIGPTKNLVKVLLVLNVFLIIYWIYNFYTEQDFRFLIFVSLFIVTPFILLLHKIHVSSDKKDYTQISKILKYIMLAGLISLILFKI
ncbi:MAG: geranylgeranylglycerol-phosphate geranylgeranyltransferase [Saprospiraceae bacterium]|nr:geranylgeranylglycerol-phosphate geranylgeranyltransferase [Saprospiraceae bacterium]